MVSFDIHLVRGNTPGMAYLTWAMSKFLALGFSLEQVVAMATAAPAGVINRAGKLGTLQVGARGRLAAGARAGVLASMPRATPARGRRISGPCRRSPPACRADAPATRPRNAPVSRR